MFDQYQFFLNQPLHCQLLNQPVSYFIPGRYILCTTTAPDYTTFCEMASSNLKTLMTADIAIKNESILQTLVFQKTQG